MKMSRHSRTHPNFHLPRACRCNIVVMMFMDGLVDHEFAIGPVGVRGIRLCEPCSYLAKTTFPELKGLVHKGGLRAQILTEG